MLGYGLFELIPVEESGALDGLGSVGLGTLLLAGAAEAAAEAAAKVTGLAWTQFGGDTLEIEVTYYKGKGGLVLTGKLGEVMKESASIALSYVRANAATYNIDPKLFEENDIHIHVPEGATPKDGPSAGVTLATAILSCLTNKKVRCDLGMTGEITLRGNVLAIGGLREKSIAALRSGLKEILIPNDNAKDIEEIPDEVKSKLKITKVSHVTEVFEKAFR